MNQSHMQAEIEWRDGRVPISTRFDDPYYSLENGLAETRHVFLGGNELPDRVQGVFHIAELGFGTGLNFLTTWRDWGDHPLHFTSFEAYPMPLDQVRAALNHFPELADLAPLMLAHWGQLGQSEMQITDNITLNVIVGDARDTLAAWDGRADAWYLDGFSPAKNPELWGEDLMMQVGAHTKPGGTLATYTAAGFVRRGLEQAGFEITRTPGYGRKRHMTKGVKT